MAAINFPDSPSVNDIYAHNGFTYKWNGTVWLSVGIGTTRISNIREIDDISSSFNGSTTQFALQVAGASVAPVTAQQMIISIGGVIQNPTDDYSISGSNIVFSTPPASGIDFFGTILGTDLSLNTITDGTVTPAKMSTGGPSWATDGTVGITSGINIVGVTTIGGVTKVTDATQSTSKDTGSLVIEGGLGLEGNINAGWNITAVGNLSAVNGTFSGDVSIGGTLTKQDVTNIDSVGLITARTGIKVTAGGIDVALGDVDIADGKLGVGTVAPGARVEIYDDLAQGLIVRSAATQNTDSNKALRVRNNSATDTFSVSHKGLVYSATKLNVGTAATVDTTGFYIGGNSTFIKTTGASLPALTVAGVTTSTGGFMIGITSATSTVITNGPIKTLNFVGAGNTFQVTGTTVDISIAGGGGGGSNGLSQFMASGVGPGATIRTK